MKFKTFLETSLERLYSSKFNVKFGQSVLETSRDLDNFQTYD